mmetsp:Transcript_29605/g.87764  ORF Transcript_29605/g.87764 Transcript_29605/m.87764 type:complete len:385 (+) Transcript_29605:827-1981(+)
MLLEPFQRLVPALPKADDRLESQVPFGRLDVEPAVHRQYQHVEVIELEGGIQDPSHELGDVRQHEEEGLGEMELSQYGGEAHGDDGLVHNVPKDEVLIALGVGGPVRDDVEFAQRGRVGLEGAFGDDETVAVIVDVGEADAILPLAEHPQLAVPGGLEEVRKEQVVPRPVHLMGGDGHGHQVGGARLPHGQFAHRLGLGVRLQVLLQRQRRHLVLGQSVHVRPHESRRRRAGHDDLPHPRGFARVDHVQRASVIHPLVQFLRMERPDRRGVVPDAIGPPHGVEYRVSIGNVPRPPFDVRMTPRRFRGGHNVERYYLPRSSLDEHFDEAQADEAGAAGHDAYGGDRGVGESGGGILEGRVGRGEEGHGFLGRAGACVVFLLSARY